MKEEFLTIPQVLKELQIEEVELKHLVSTGHLRTVQDSKETKFEREQVMRLKEEREESPTAKLAKPPRDPESG